MLDLTATQIDLLARNFTIDWLFDITDINLNKYYWSTKNTESTTDAIHWDGSADWDVDASWAGEVTTTYVFNIVDFQNIIFRRLLTEASVMPSNEFELTVLNKGDAYTPSDFVDGQIWVQIQLRHESRESVIALWRFRIKSANARYQTVHLICEDWYAKYLESDWPNTKLVKDIFPSSDPDWESNLCAPVPFGTAYIPLRSIYTSNDRFYLLGPTTVGGSAVTYTISKVHSPHYIGTPAAWDDSFTMTQSVEADAGATDWQVFQPIIADTDDDGTADAIGLWQSGDSYLDIPTKFSRSDLSSKTNFADVVKYLLEDFGIGVAYLKEASFEECQATYIDWGLTFNYGFYKKEARADLLARILSACHSTLVVEDQIKLVTHSAVSRGTITKAQVIKRDDRSLGEFRRYGLIEKLPDSGNVGWQQDDEPQDLMQVTLVPAKATTSIISSETLEIPFDSNSINVQTAASLHFQRNFLKNGTVSFTGMPICLKYQPGDIITISDTDFGGTYNAMVETVHVNKDLSINVNASTFSDTLDDWDDLNFSAITISVDDKTGMWQAVLTGPESTLVSGNPSEIPGGAGISFLADGSDPAVLKFKGAAATTKFSSGDGTSLDIGMTNSGTVKLRIHQDDAVSDDAEVVVMTATSGIVFVSCNAEAGMWLVQSDGTCTKIAGTANTADSDSDGDLCVYQVSTAAKAKNRLGATGEMRFFTFFN
jgi:hypothetical protein